MPAKDKTMSSTDVLLRELQICSLCRNAPAPAEHEHCLDCSLDLVDLTPDQWLEREISHLILVLSYTFSDVADILCRSVDEIMERFYSSPVDFGWMKVNTISGSIWLQAHTTQG